MLELDVRRTDTLAALPAVELRPMESVTVSVSVWLPSATSCVFHTVDAVVLDVVCVNF